MNPARKFWSFITASFLFALLFSPVSAATLPLKLTNVGTVAIPENLQENLTNVWYTGGPRPQFKGTTTAGAQVCLTIESPAIEGCATAGSDGIWAWTPPSDISNGDHKTTITATKNSDQGSMSFTLGMNTSDATGDPLYQVAALTGLSLLASLFAIGAFQRKWKPTL